MSPPSRLRSGADGNEQSSARALLFSAVLMAVVWMVCVAGFKRNEMIVGCVAAASGTAFVRLVWKSRGFRADLRTRSLMQVWRVPENIASDLAAVTLVLLKDLLRIRSAGSHFRACDFDISCSDPVKIGNAILTTSYSTVSPNLIVVGIDGDTRRMLFHQLEPGDVPKLARNMGAKA